MLIHPHGIAAGSDTRYLSNKIRAVEEIEGVAFYLGLSTNLYGNTFHNTPTESPALSQHVYILYVGVKVPESTKGVVSCVVPVGNESWMWFQEGRSSNLRLRRGVGQAAHTCNNPHVKCTGVY